MNRVTARLITALALLAPAAAHADYYLISPYEIDLGELELEHNGDSVFDNRPGQTRAASYTAEFGTGLTPWWHSELEFGFDRAPGAAQPTLLSQLVTENMFQLTEPGQAPVDLGFYFEYGQSLTTGVNAASNEVTAGLVAGKSIGHTLHLLNLLFSHEFGPDQSSQGTYVTYAWQSRWVLWEPLSPAIEVYGGPGIMGAFPRLTQQQLLAGPVGVGALKLHDLGLGSGGKIKYEVGWLFGATDASPRNVLRWRLELELPF